MIRNRKGPWKHQDPDVFDISLDPLITVPDGSGTRQASAADLLWHRTFQRALDKDYKSICIIFKMIKADRDMAKKHLSSRKSAPTDLWYGPISNDHSLAAGLILGIYVTHPQGSSALRVKPVGYLENKQPVYFDRWVFETALDRLGWPPHCIERFASEFVDSAGEPVPFVFEESSLFVPPVPRRLPQETQFQKGRSGNPKGRPPNVKKQPPFEFFFAEEVPYKIAGKKRLVTRAEAFIHKVNLIALNGDDRLRRMLADFYVGEHCNRWLRGSDDDGYYNIVLEDGRPESEYLSSAPKAKVWRNLELISRGTKRKLLFRPWLVNLALSRLDGRRLHVEAQKEVVRASAKRSDVDWPDWWDVRPWVRNRRKS